MQGLQVAPADGDVGTMRALGRPLARQAIARGIKAVIGQLLQLDLQRPPSFVVRPDFLACVLLIERLQIEQCRKVDAHRDVRARDRQLRQGGLHQCRIAVFGCGDQWRSEQ